MAIIYLPNFQHQEWVDNQDRVMAGGANGFNVRFNAIESEFQTLAPIFQEIATALNALGQAPPPTSTFATITPALVAASASAWQGGLGVMIKPASATSAWGVMSVDLVNGAVVQSFRATGRNPANGNLRIALQRQAVVSGGPLERIAGLDNIAGDPFDLAVNPAAPLATVNNQLFKYLITAQIDNAEPAQPTMLNAFQIQYLRP